MHAGIPRGLGRLVCGQRGALSLLAVEPRKWGSWQVGTQEEGRPEEQEGCRLVAKAVYGSCGFPWQLFFPPS